MLNRHYPFLVLGVVMAGFLLWFASPVWSIPKSTPEQFLQEYIGYEASYDSAVAELYADDAIIQVKRVLPSGDDWTEYIPALHYKAMLRQLMPLARVSKDASEYTLLKQEPTKKERIRLKVRRYDQVGQYTSPLELVIGPNPNKPEQWLIYEERSEIHTATNVQ